MRDQAKLEAKCVPLLVIPVASSSWRNFCHPSTVGVSNLNAVDAQIMMRLSMHKLASEGEIWMLEIGNVGIFCTIVLVARAGQCSAISESL